MTWCYESAAARHLADAVLLRTEGRYGNALYLAGYVAECSMKAVVDHCGGHASDYGHRLVRLEGEAFDLAVSLSPGLVRYRPDRSKARELSSRWSETRRYLATSETEGGPAAAGIELATHFFEVCVGGMFLDGLLPELPE